MPYWNRDLIEKDGEAFKCWHEECFPVALPTAHEKAGFATREEHAAYVFGGSSLGSLEAGIDHMIDLALSSEHYADQVERYLTRDDHFTPDGYAWAPWRGGANCDKCGQPA